MKFSSIILSEYLSEDASEIRKRYITSFYKAFRQVDWDNLTPTQERVWIREDAAIRMIDQLPQSQKIIAEGLVCNHGLGYDSGGACFEPSYALNYAKTYTNMTSTQRRKSQKNVFR